MLRFLVASWLKGMWNDAEQSQGAISFRINYILTSFVMECKKSLNANLKC